MHGLVFIVPLVLVVDASVEVILARPLYFPVLSAKIRHIGVLMDSCIR